MSGNGDQRLGPGTMTTSGTGARTPPAPLRPGDNGAGLRPVAGRATPQSYYGKPIIAEPVWSWEIPLYFFTGGLGGASAMLAAGADLTGRTTLARRAWLCALAGVGVSPPLLISDLGRPARFLNMLRMVKVTSPMSMGTWLLLGTSGATAAATANNLFGLLGPAGRIAKPVAGALGGMLTTYTAVLISDTAVPVWHEARRELPFLFAASAAASAGAAATLTTPSRHAAPARLLAAGGAAASVGVMQLMEHRLGEVGEPYSKGTPGILGRAAEACAACGAAAVAFGGRRRPAVARAGAGLLLAGAVLERWSVFRAGFASARDPKYTVGPQRARADARAG
ncbi:MAG TPA: NrfD/PsrC family molybdoenzyme membrane anchor subunit [Solirubrobacteraceae bacterium]|nr:NrfD/PsrC family molybdoenzyme membrane anchor subunit [Solirubrobacteraceae bacterium]